MRTTLDISDNAYRIAKAVARENDQSLGRTISDLIEKGALGSLQGTNPAAIETEAGLPVVSIGRPISSEEVLAFLEESQ